MAQVRGSIPLRWGEAGSFMSLKPRPELDGGGERTSDHLHLDPLSQHLTALQQTYGEVALLSLIEQKEASHERAMGLVFERLVRSFLDRVRGGVREGGREGGWVGGWENYGLFEKCQDENLQFFTAKKTR